MPAAIVTPPPQERADPVSNPGSLYDPDGATSLFADARARRVGDVVLIPIRVGVGARLGANVGYMKFRKKQNWVPF